MKVEPRGKFGGVKIHLDGEEAQTLTNWPDNSTFETDHAVLGLALKMRKKILQLMKEDPNVLTDRTPEQVQAILIKEAEKAQLQLQASLAQKDISKLDPQKLKSALLKYVKEDK